MKVWMVCVAAFLTQLNGTRSSAETLGQLLSKSGIPSDHFSQAELAEEVEGGSAKNDAVVFMAFLNLHGEQLTGPISIATYDISLKTGRRATLQMEDDDICEGSLNGIVFLKDYTVVSTLISPSAGCLLIVDTSLVLKREFYGFAPVEVAPGLIVLTESMIHFATVHPERLQAASLADGKKAELYPPAKDALRARLTAAHARHMPSHEICATMNDPCDPRMFVEFFGSIKTDGRGRFSFVATQTASHFLKPNADVTLIASQSVLYTYQLSQGTWKYCQRELPQPLPEGHSPIAEEQTCDPNLPVLPDLSTADYNPFFKR